MSLALLNVLTASFVAPAARPMMAAVRPASTVAPTMTIRSAAPFQFDSVSSTYGAGMYGGYSYSPQIYSPYDDRRTTYDNYGGYGSRYGGMYGGYGGGMMSGGYGRGMYGGMGGYGRGMYGSGYGGYGMSGGYGRGMYGGGYGGYGRGMYGGYGGGYGRGMY